MKKIIYLISFLILLVTSAKPVSAIYDPTSVPNNIFGIHIADTNDIVDTAKLVNSNGDWGYVTLVIQKGERDTNRWQRVFDEMRRLHLIPIVRIATAPIAGNNNIWEKPSVDEIDGWVSFLNSLNWVIKNRYIIIANEPNHAKEWGGVIDPAGYANYLTFFSRRLKEINPDFFIMAAGFDAAANTQNGKDPTMDEGLYLQKMFEENPEVMKYIDGWASHSYPVGRNGITTYDWELNYLKFLGLNRDLPVFITETGWTHNSELTTDIGPKIENAFQNVWEKDSRVVAVTPFIYKYLDPPFDIFSWGTKDGKFYDFYYTVQNLNKTKGAPIQEDKADILTGVFPKLATAGSSYQGLLFIKNIGQAIWEKDNTQVIDVNSGALLIDSVFPASIEPNQIGIFLVKGAYPNISGGYTQSIELLRNGKILVSGFNNQVTIISGLPTLNDILTYIKNEIIRRLGTI